MQRPVIRLSLAEFASAGVSLRPAEAVVVVRELAEKVSRGEIPGVPSSHVIRIASDGALSVEGPVVAGGRPVARAAQLLESLLPGFDAPPEFRVPGALRLVVARALGTLDLPPYPSLETFTKALARFAPGDPHAVLAQLAASLATAKGDAVDEVGSAAPETGAELATLEERPVRELTFRAGSTALTISDIRRARRATGLTLSEISTRSRIPAPLLRELEWGYLRNWPAGHYGRTQLIRYARAAGLDDQIVVRTVWPMLEEAAAESGIAPPAAAALPIAEGEIVEAAPAVAQAAPVPRRASWNRRALAALAIPALIAIGVVPAVWELIGTGGQRSAQLVTSAPPPRQPEPAGPVRPAATPSEPAIASAAAGPVRTPHPDKTSPVGRSPHAAVGLPNDAVPYSPSFATTGSAMFYHAEADGRSSLMRADTDSGGAILKITTVVDDRANNFHARPSPDGTQIAFDSDRDGERGVYVADSTGHNVRKVSGAGFAAVPSWSPDGGRLALVRAEPGKPHVWNLWTVDLTTGEMRRLTSHPYGQPWGGSWFPDGRHIAYSHEDDLIVLDTENGTHRIYHSPKPGHLLRTPAVSPNGRRIIFQVYRDGAWMLELRDGSMRKVLSDPSAEEYTWSPDGRRVAFHSRRSGEWGVWLMAARN